MSEVSGDREELTCVQGQGRQPGGDTPHPRSGRWLGEATPRLRPVAAGRRYPASEVRGGREKPPCARGQGRRPGGATRGAVAAQAQEGLEELYHVEGKERRQ